MQNLPLISPSCPQFRKKAQERISQLLMPPLALGQLLDLATDLVSITRSLTPATQKKRIFIFGADHGIYQEGVSIAPQETTTIMMKSFTMGLAAINVLANQAKAQTLVIDMGVKGNLQKLINQGKIINRSLGPGTNNMTKGPAMTGQQAIKSISHGIELAKEYADSTDVYATGEMGICNTTASSAILAAITQTDPILITDKGTGISEQTLINKIKVIKKALDINKPNSNDPLDVLQKVGGMEIGGMTGLILGAAYLQKPVIIDGFISSVAALLAYQLIPNSLDYMIFSHMSAEKGHRLLLNFFRKKPLLQLNMRLGEGTGATLAMNLVEAGAKIITEMGLLSELNITLKN